jgi:excisionase family DNA binding protein
MVRLVGATEMGHLLGGLHRCTVLRWAEQGLIPSVKVGKYRRFDADEVLQAFRSGAFDSSRGASSAAVPTTARRRP